jgi:hypothetical protein
MKKEEDVDDIREDPDPVPVLVATTSSSSSNEELEHAELSLSPTGTASTSGARPLSWWCMLADVLPSCSAEPAPTASPSSREVKQREDFQQAFSNGSLLPYIVNSFLSTSTSTSTSQQPPAPSEFEWNGLLPLDPVPQGDDDDDEDDNDDCIPNHNKQRHRIRKQPQDLADSFPSVHHSLVCTSTSCRLFGSFFSCLVFPVSLFVSLTWLLMRCTMIQPSTTPSTTF